MPRYTPNQQNSTAALEVFNKDEYEFVIGEPKAFYNAAKDNTATGGVEKGESYGIRYVLTHAAGPYAGKKYIKTLYLHSEGGRDMAKQFMMPAYGFQVNAEAEAEFNKKIVEEGLDDSFNTDDGSVGSYWTHVKGGRVKGALDVGTYNNKAQNKEVGWSPL